VCTGDNLIVEISPNIAEEQSIMLIKLEDEVFIRPVMSNATLEVGPCTLNATSDLFGNLIFKSLPACKMYRNGDGKLKVSDDIATFVPLKVVIQINESQYFRVKPYLVIKLSFVDNANDSVKGNDLMVTIGSEQHKVIRIGTTNEEGFIVTRIPQSQVGVVGTKIFVSYSDMQLRFSQGDFSFEVPTGNSYSYTHKLMR
jgi:hypothetical protein